MPKWCFGARGHSKSCGGELEELILAILLLHWTVGHLQHTTIPSSHHPRRPLELLTKVSCGKFFSCTFIIKGLDGGLWNSFKNTVSFLAFSRAKLVDSRNNCGNVFFFFRFSKEFIPRMSYTERGVLYLYFAVCTLHMWCQKNLLSFEEINHAPNYPLYLPSIIISVAVAAAMYNNHM